MMDKRSKNTGKRKYLRPGSRSNNAKLPKSLTPNQKLFSDKDLECWKKDEGWSPPSGAIDDDHLPPLTPHEKRREQRKQKRREAAIQNKLRKREEREDALRRTNAKKKAERHQRMRSGWTPPA